MKANVNVNIKKLAAAGMMTALGVCLSAFSIPVGASRCFPIQHLLNVLAGIFLGPAYGVGFAFSTALIRISGGVIVPADRKNLDCLCRRNPGYRDSGRNALLSGGRISSWK